MPTVLDAYNLLCPLLKENCKGNRCVWWLPGKLPGNGDCAIALIATDTRR